ncbi:MAG TPA: SusC/RagA family TonB-linked outer membrane protein [Gemmatimonadaceae bacterium]|nr:SusC/RagA family TonB-linked outer membrane protein [Gemmatimonadaceae bacterium]
MALGRILVPALVGALCWTTQLGAQGTTGSINGRVLDSASQQPVAGATVRIQGTQRAALTRDDGGFVLSAVPAGTYRVRATRIGYGPLEQGVTVTAGATANVTFSLTRQAAVLSEVVTTGYGTQRREAITGSVATVQAAQANVGLVTNADQMLQSRVAGVQLTQNSGEPGAGVQLRIRGGTSISASNDPLYVVDGVPLQNADQTPGALGLGGGGPQLARNPLNSINPNDIESITVLKDASATAIYGSRGANGVVLITTKRGSSGSQTEYETYVGASTPAKTLGLLNGDQYRAFVKAQVASGGLPLSADSALGTANTDWERAITRTGLDVNHNLSFSGGSEQTQYRASLNYFDQKGVVLGNGLQRYQGRLNATHSALSGKLQLGLNLMASRVNNQFADIENGGGFLGGVFTNMIIFNPTFPVRAANGSFFEVGTGAQDVRNPVGITEQLQDNAPENRILGNLTGTLSLLPELTAQTTLGIDNTQSVRQTFAPRSSAIGAAFNGLARQGERHLQNLNLQQLLTYSPHFGSSELEVLGGYEYTTIQDEGFEAQMQGFITDAFGVNNLGAGTQASSPVPTSYDNQSTLVSFFSRANYGFAHKYFLTGVVRYDGSSRLAPGHQWSLFPALSASWRMSEESWFRGGPFSTLAIRAGWGKQGNQAVQPYQTQLLLRADPGAAYPFGGVLTSGLRAAQVGNPDLKWETSTQTNVGVDYGVLHDRVTGSIDLYQKDTKDLLLDVAVPQPAVVPTRLENIGSLRNRGLEASADAQLYASRGRTLSGGLVLTVERNEVTSLGPNRKQGINTGFVSGQGQSNQYSQRIMIGQPIGTFFAPKFVGVVNGHQIFACKATSAGCDAATLTTTDPTDDDRQIIGSANPDFTVGLHNNGTWGNFDASWLWRGEFGGKVFNNTALVYASKGDARQGRNFLSSALSMPDSITEAAKYSSRWIEDRTFVRLQNVTVGYTFTLPARLGIRSTRVYVAGDNLLLFTHYTGYDPEVFTDAGLASRGIDYLTYPRARTYTLGARFQF